MVWVVLGWVGDCVLLMLRMARNSGTLSEPTVCRQACSESGESNSTAGATCSVKNSKRKTAGN